MAQMRGSEALHRAIQDGSLEEVKNLVSEGANMDEVLGMRGTALCAAIEARNQSIAKYLIDKGCDVNAQDFDGEPPLLLALRKEKPQKISLRTECLEIASMLIRNPKCNVNKVDPLTNKSAIHFATEQGMHEVVRWLLASPQCNINQVDVNGNTPLHSAVLNGHQETVEVLVSSPQCLLKVYNKAGMVPVHIASNTGDSKSLQIIISPGKSEGLPTLRDMELKLEAGGDISITEDTELSTNINSETIYEKDTCLHLAARNQHKDVVKLLLEAGARVNLKNNLGQTPLLISCGAVQAWLNKDNDIALMLLKAGAQPNVKAVARSNYVRRDLEVSSLILAAMNNNVPLVQALVKHGADLELADNTGRGPLYVALRENARDVARYFLTDCPGVHVNRQNDEGQTPLHAVIHTSTSESQEQYELVQLLIRSGAVISPDKNGITPIVACLMHENPVVLDALLAESDVMVDASVYDENHDDNLLLLHCAVGMGCLPIVQVLLSHGYNINALNAEGHTPLFDALENDQVAVAKFLVASGCDLSLEPYIFQIDDIYEKLASKRNDTNSDTDESDDTDDSDWEYPYAGVIPITLLNDAQLAQWLRLMATSPRSLRLSCLLSIRKHFHDNSLKFVTMDKLPLPDPLKSMLRYKVETGCFISDDEV